MIELFCDGGCIGRNPSQQGGTWAWCMVRDGIFHALDSGIVRPIDFGLKAISNNVTELMAAVRALSWLQGLVIKEDAVLWTDSKVTRHRLLSGIRPKDKSVPDLLKKQCCKLRLGRKWDVKLVGGHPTKKELESGKLVRNGLPTSEFNVWCDKECQRLAREFLDNL